LGALIVWLPGLATRRRARLAEKRARALEAELAARDRAPVVTNAPLLAGPEVINARRIG
jgi:hypothetical protein